MILEEVDAVDLAESQAELVLAELQVQGKKNTWSQNNEQERQKTHGATAIHEACQMCLRWSAWSLAQEVHESIETQKVRRSRTPLSPSTMCEVNTLCMLLVQWAGFCTVPAVRDMPWRPA